MSITRRLLVVVGVAFWCIAVYLIVIGSYYLGGGSSSSAPQLS